MPRSSSSPTEARRLGRRIALLALLGAGSSARADEAVNFEQHVKPILRANCLNCHNPDKAKGGLDMTSYAALLRGGSSGAVAEPGQPDGSALLLVTAHQREPFMPPNAPKRPDTELDVLRKWIAGGLVERAGGQARQAAPAAGLLMAAGPDEKPQGPPPMPEGLSPEPARWTGGTNSVTALAASPWAPLAAVGGHRQVLLYHTDSLRLLGVLPFPEGLPHSLRFSGDGRLLVCGGGEDGASGRVVVWDVVSGQRVVEVGDEFDAVLSADLARDRAHAAVGGTDKLVKIYATASGEVKHRIKKHTDWVTAVAYSPDGILLATGDRNGGLMVWEAANGLEFHSLEGHPAAVTALSWRRDGNVLASAGEDGTVKLWNLHNGKLIKSWSAHKDGTLCASYGMDGRIATCGRDRLAKAWDGEGREVAAYKSGDDIAIHAAFTHDSARLLAGGWGGQVFVFGPDKSAPPLGTLSANPPPIAVQIEWAMADIPKLAEARAQAGEARDKARAQGDEARDRAAAQMAARQHAAQTLQAAEAALAAAAKARDEAQAARDAAHAKADALRTRAGDAQGARDREAAALESARAALQAAEAAPPAQRDAVEQSRVALEQARADALATPEYPPAREAAAAAEQALASATARLQELERALADARSAAEIGTQRLAQADEGVASARKEAEDAAVLAKEKQVLSDQASAAIAPAEKTRADAAAAGEAAAKALADAEAGAKAAADKAAMAEAALAGADRALDDARDAVVRLKAAELDRIAEKARARLAVQGGDDSLAVALLAARGAVERLDAAPAATTTPEAAANATTQQGGGRRANLALLFVGRYHLVLLHLPIGLLFGVLLLELEHWRTRSVVAGRVAGHLLNAGALLAAATSFLGLLLAWNGRYEGLELALHQWLGIATAAGAVAAAILRRSSLGLPHPLYRPALFAACAGIALTGHLGGTMTHGRGFLTQHLPDWVEALRGGSPYADAAGGSALFASAIEPIFEQHCHACHGSDEQKGGYRLDRREEALAGGKSGRRAIVPGSPFGSSLATRILLPRSHDEAMPPANKPELRPEEILAVVCWIAAGAEWTEAPAPAEEPVPHRAGPDPAAAGPQVSRSGP